MRQISRPKRKSKANHQSAKPYAEFPLTAHPSGRWCKKHRGKQYYFGPIDNWQSALEKYKHEWPYIIDGRTPPPEDTGDGCTVRSLCNGFLTSKRSRLDAGELSARTFENYYTTCDLLISHFSRDRRVDDLRPDDFARLRKAMANRWGPVRLRNTITRVRMVFKFAFDERLIEQPMHYGQSFAPPSAKTLRKARNEAGPRMFEAHEICTVLDAVTDPQFTAMILLGINCGFGNTDVSNLPQSAIDFENGWIDFPRPKTEIHRRIPLWEETVAALKKATSVRPKHKDKADADSCFLTPRGNRWTRTKQCVKDSARFTKVDAVARCFSSLLQNLDINGRKGLGFYTLRHVFETIAGESKDQVAVNAIMGHVDSSMAGVYRERISDERLTAVTDTVHRWLFGN